MIKSLAKRVLLASGVLPLAGSLRRPGVAILMYHSVLEDPTREANSLGGIVHSTAEFRGQMELLARQFQPVGIDDVSEFVASKKDLSKRAVVVTFDDGYADNCEVALPLLDRYGIPAAFYVTVDCIENRRLPWPSRLRFAFRSTRKKDWTDQTGKTWSLQSDNEWECAYLQVCDEICKLAGSALELGVTQIEDQLEARLPPDSGQLMMTWDQAKSMAEHGHIVGSHTLTHPNLAFVDAASASRELAESKCTIEARIQKPVTHFSYPCPALFPNWTEATTNEIRRLGYRTAVTTDNGLVHHGDHPLRLKRVRPTKTVAGLRWNLENAFAGRAV